MKLTYIVNKELDKKFVNLASPVIKKNFDLFYSNNSNILNETAKLYQNSWNKINDNFSTLVENYTEHKWYYPEYFCVVSVNVTGVGSHLIFTEHGKKTHIYNCELLRMN